MFLYVGLIASKNSAVNASFVLIMLLFYALCATQLRQVVSRSPTFIPIKLGMFWVGPDTTRGAAVYLWQGLSCRVTDRYPSGSIQDLVVWLQLHICVSRHSNSYRFGCPLMGTNGYTGKATFMSVAETSTGENGILCSDLCCRLGCTLFVNYRK